MPKHIKRIMFLAVICSYAFSHFYFSCCIAKEDKWEERKSTHFIIYYKNPPDDFIDRLVEAAERYYEEIIDEMGFSRYDNFWLWDNRAKIYVFDSQDDYAKTTGQPAWAGGHVFSKGKVIWTYPWAAGFFDTLLAHEMGHIVFREIIGNRADIPTWLDEGIACYQERSRRWGAMKTVIDAFKAGKFINFEHLNSSGPYQLSSQDSVDLFYSEAISIIHFLVERYDKYRFQKFIQSLKTAVNVDSALNSAYYDFKTLKDLGKAWEDYIKKKAQ